jgi:hypothetical protein
MGGIQALRERAQMAEALELAHAMEAAKTARALAVEALAGESRAGHQWKGR